MEANTISSFVLFIIYFIQIGLYLFSYLSACLFAVVA